MNEQELIYQAWLQRASHYSRWHKAFWRPSQKFAGGWEIAKISDNGTLGGWALDERQYPPEIAGVIQCGS